MNEYEQDLLSHDGKVKPYLHGVPGLFDDA